MGRHRPDKSNHSSSAINLSYLQFYCPVTQQTVKENFFAFQGDSILSAIKADYSMTNLIIDDMLRKNGLKSDNGGFRFLIQGRFCFAQFFFFFDNATKVYAKLLFCNMLG